MAQPEAATIPESDGLSDMERLAQDERIQALCNALDRAVAQRGESKVQTLSGALFNLIERGFWRPGDKARQNSRPRLVALALGAPARPLVAVLPAPASLACWSSR